MPILLHNCCRHGQSVRIASAALLLSGILGSACSSGARDATAPVAPAPRLPGAPTNVVATALDGSVSLAFAPPVTDGGSAITGYAASCAAGSSSGSATGTTSPIRVAGLVNGTSYTCTVAATNAVGTGPTTAAVSVRPVATLVGPFRGNIVLGNPTTASVRLNVYASDQSGTVQVVYGTAPGSYDKQSASLTLNADTPLVIPLDGLAPNTRYWYRLNYTGAGGGGPTAESSFHTARPPGSTFTFMVQGDSHPERLRQQFDSALYVKTLSTAAADAPDFYVMLGDDFSIDQINETNPAAVTQAQVRQRYTIQRPYLGIIGRSAPVFLVNGNHEQAARYLLDGTANNPAVWAQNARNSLFAQPAPDAFYSGNQEVIPNIGLLRNYYAFQWGDALFVMIDPYWGSPVCVDNPFFGGNKRSDLWSVTHGDAQYQWLKNTLERSTARHKFVFAHHVLGTQRGGIEVAKLYEWGGLDGRGANQFAAQRPTWSAPIHQLFVQNRVSAFFQGHDHIWVHQQLDGVTYQTVSEPADPNYSLFNDDAYQTGERFPNSGYTRVTVAPTGVKVEYVRMFLGADDNPTQKSGTVAFSYTIP